MKAVTVSNLIYLQENVWHAGGIVWMETWGSAKG